MIIVVKRSVAHKPEHVKAFETLSGLRQPFLESVRRMLHAYAKSNPTPVTVSHF